MQIKTFYKFFILFMIQVNFVNSSYFRIEKHIPNMFKDFNYIETERLNLRKISKTDTESIFAMMSDPRVIESTAAWEVHQDIKTTEEFVDGIIKNYNQDNLPDSIILAITNKSDKKVVGMMVFVGITPIFSRTEFGYVIAPEFWSKGYATEASKCLIDFAFKNMGLNRIEATVFTDNIGSIRVLEKCNLKHEGTMRQHVQRNGQFRDRKLYAILKQDWQF